MNHMSLFKVDAKLVKFFMLSNGFCFIFFEFGMKKGLGFLWIAEPSALCDLPRCVFFFFMV